MKPDQIEELFDALLDLCGNQSLALADLSARLDALEKVLKANNRQLSAALARALAAERKKSAERVAQAQTMLVKLRDKASRVQN